MADDWRVTITLSEARQAGRVLAELREREVHDELRDALGGRVAVSSDGPRLFLYADTRRAAEAGEHALREVLAEDGIGGEPKLERWHPVEERWEDPAVVLSAAEEHERAEEEDAEESIETGVAQWEVRVELETHQAAESLADELTGDGYSVVRRSRYLLVGANDEDDAKALAARLEGRGTVHVEPGSGVAYQLLPQNPFAVFGGLAG
ncbi:MAG TPA: hypothetical protein VHC67_16860 [Gaiellaceae bacterium]|nr:hypothetical protein [Gaiellaceae bacterium]